MSHQWRPSSNCLYPSATSRNRFVELLNKPADVSPENDDRLELQYGGALGVPRTGRMGPMKRSKFSEEQVAYALRQAESGTAVGDVCRQVGISEATFYAWKKKYAHLGVSELRRLRQIEEENTRLKRLVADLSLDKHMLSEALRAGWLVSSHLPGQLRAGLPTRAVQSRGLVSKESSAGSDGAAPPYPRARARAAPLRVLAHLGLAAP